MRSNAVITDGSCRQGGILHVLPETRNITCAQPIESLPVDPVLLASLLCSRLCHDLVGPVGAVANGLEFISEDIDEDLRREADTLMASSISQIVRRLALFRLTFGSSGSTSGQIDIREAERVAREYYLGSRISFDWRGDAQGLGKTEVRLALCLVILAGEALGRGGTLWVEFAGEEGGRQIRLRAEGERLTVHEGVGGLLTGEADSSTADPRSAPALLARALADNCGATLSVNVVPEQTFEIDVTL